MSYFVLFNLRLLPNTSKQNKTQHSWFCIPTSASPTILEIESSFSLKPLMANDHIYGPSPTFQQVYWLAFKAKLMEPSFMKGIIRLQCPLLTTVATLWIVMLLSTFSLCPQQTVLYFLFRLVGGSSISKQSISVWLGATRIPANRSYKEGLPGY